ncbi:MAG: DegT/DnrJ/EryC1/StrS family aminotransferase [Promethearchaeota archaeon]
MEKLAVDGGQKSITRDQEELLKWPKMGVEEEEAVVELMRRGEISQSREPELLAKEFSEFIGTKYALAKVNGTACLLSAFFSAGVGPGDEVIVPTNTYWASAMPAAFLGAKIVFCESEPDNFCIDPVDIRKKVTDRTKVIVPVHLYGYPCEMDEIMEIAGENDITVIEDASHAHGAEYKGKKIGSIGHCGVFSLQASKIMPAGEAGILVTNDVEIHEKATSLGHYQLIPSLERDTYKKYAKTGLGLKHRLSPLHAAIARCQLKKFNGTNSTITKNCEKFRDAIKDIEGLGFIVPETPKHVNRVYFMNQLIYEDGDGTIPREELLFMLKSEGILAGKSRYDLLHYQPYFVENGHGPSKMPFTENLVSKMVSFPTFPWDEDGSLVDEYIAGVEKVAYYLRMEL